MNHHTPSCTLPVPDDVVDAIGKRIQSCETLVELRDTLAEITDLVDRAINRNQMPYQQYLDSPWWQQMRRAALSRAGHACQVCNTKDETLDVHHRTYDRRGVELPSDLIVLCRGCHAIFHEKGKLAPL